MCLIAVVAAAAFMSCSSDNAATAPEQVATFADLGECNSLSEGVTKQVAADGLYYKCVAGGWQETEWVPDNSGTLAGSVLLDSRDGQTYKTVTIGTQTWMAENLNYKMDGTICPSDSYCKTHTCHKYYGYLNYEYDHCSPLPDTTIWPDAGCYYRSNSALSACPSGWHLPSLDEWKILFEAVGGTDVAAKMLKVTMDVIAMERTLMALMLFLQDIVACSIGDIIIVNAMEKPKMDYVMMAVAPSMFLIKMTTSLMKCFLVVPLVEGPFFGHQHIWARCLAAKKKVTLSANRQK